MNDAIRFAPLGMNEDSIRHDFQRYFHCTLGREGYATSSEHQFTALALMIRDRLMERCNRTRHAYEKKNSRKTCYFSMEYLLGRSLRNAVLNLGMDKTVKDAMESLGLSLEEIMEREHDAGLGNGGLGRLAACFLDSCATLQLPVIGYGLRYRYGMFRQKIENGFQVEAPEHWLRDGHPWEIERPDLIQRVHFRGHTDTSQSDNGRPASKWLDTHDVLAIPYDVPIPGYRNGTVNTLRLWSSAATDEFNLDEFNAGSYPEAVAAKTAAENITMVLYPNDASENGRELRLQQQYFLASASLKDTLRHWYYRHGADFEEFEQKHCFQLNDTHPSIAVAELMRLLIDVYGVEWNRAWHITTSTMAYTNHTLLPEALECWSVKLFERLLPRLLEIIYEINARWLQQVAKRWPGDVDRQRRLSLIDDGHDPMVRMAYLAVVGSFSVNGVAKLHSQLLQKGLFKDFYDISPNKFNNKTNGVTQRRWLASCNPGLSRLITDVIGEGWRTDLDQLNRLRQTAEDAGFGERWSAVKFNNKLRLADLVQAETDVELDPSTLFDVQVKRVHEYKRQLLNVLHVIHRYIHLKDGMVNDATNARSVIIGGKAAPGYFMAKLIVKLINEVARVVNSEADVSQYLKLVFLPNYRVSMMEIICPGTELSEQISTAGKEASGTGNMKFMMNGALTIGTLDGANVEILDAVGEENFFMFGLSAQQVAELTHSYQPQQIVDQDPDLAAVIALLRSGHFNRDEPGLFDPIIDSILSPMDPWMTAADFRAYVKAQESAAEAYLDRARWARMSILNTAASAYFSTDRTITQYNSDIWHLDPVHPNSVSDGGNQPIASC